MFARNGAQYRKGADRHWASKSPPLVAAAVILPALVAVHPAWAGDPEQGRLIASRCAACHGPLGVPSSPMIPRLAGQSGDYLFEQLQRFKEGVRVSPIMSPVAESLTSLEMSDVATYFAELHEQKVETIAAPSWQQSSNKP